MISPTILFTSLAMITSYQGNPLLHPFNTPYGTPPFNSITSDDFLPAIEQAISEAQANIDAITANPQEATFQNTIVALEYAGQPLDRVLNVFYPLVSANSDDTLMQTDVNTAQMLSEYSAGITLNEALWNRIKHVYDSQLHDPTLTPEDRMLLTETYSSFARNGANLQGGDREEYRRLSAELSRLTTQFGQNVLKGMDGCELIVTRDCLGGLPDNLIETASAVAKDRGLEDGTYVIELNQPTYMALMRSADNRDLRQEAHYRYSSRNISGEYSNLDIIRQISKLRSELAQLLGFKNFAEYKLQSTMAQTPDAVMDLLCKLKTAYEPAWQKEKAELQDFARTESNGSVDELQAWDYSYYANKLKQQRYNYDEQQLRPYLPLDSVINGVFGLATKLYGITLTIANDVEVYHPDVKAYRVNDKDGSYLGILYADFFPRASKRPGAWMTEFSPQHIDTNGKMQRPHISVVMNFTKPTASQPALLSPYEVETFLHEFGHALHGLFANTHYVSLAGTNVYRDFVELPSQFNENFLTQKDFLKEFAHHYQTDETIPDSLIEAMQASSQYGAAYQCIRQLMFGFLDMAYHTATTSISDAADFELSSLSDFNMFPKVEGTLISPQFSHIFSGGYAAGYYSYKWAEVLDADAFAMFKAAGVFNTELADSFRRNILEKGGTVHPAILYRNFRGQDPNIDALMQRDGIIPHNK